MEYLKSFFSYKLSDIHQTYYNRLHIYAQNSLCTLERKDQEKLLDTLSKQSEDRVVLLVLILTQQKEEVIQKLFKKEVRLLNALLKADTNYLEDTAKTPEYIESVIMNEKQGSL